MSSYSTRQLGKLNSLAFRLYVLKDGQPISPFHDIPLWHNKANKIANMVVEVPRWSQAKLEITKEEDLNPIKQDIKKGKLRFVKNVFPHKGYIWNYGALPQTWEDPGHVDEATKAKGDNDPVDVIEIGEAIAYPGEVKQVKILGVIALLDEGETDWKIFAIDVRDPLAEKLHDMPDVEKYFPGLVEATQDWFKIYKIPDGKPENKFAFEGKAQNREFALKVIEQTGEAWDALINGKAKPDGIKLASVLHPSSESDISKIVASIPTGGDSGAEPIDASNDKWFYTKTML